MANGTFAKVFGWYDNEWGYSCRLVDLVSEGACEAAAVGRDRRRRRTRSSSSGRISTCRSRTGSVADDTRIRAVAADAPAAARPGRARGAGLLAPRPAEDRGGPREVRDGSRCARRLDELVGDDRVARAREHALQPAGDQERRGVRPRARRRLRPLRQRRIRLGASCARVDGGRRASCCPPTPASCCSTSCDHLGALLGDVERPFVIVSGGAKVEDKIGVLENLGGARGRGADRREDGRGRARREPVLVRGHPAPATSSLRRRSTPTPRPG